MMIFIGTLSDPNGNGPSDPPCGETGDVFAVLLLASLGLATFHYSE